MKSDLLAAPEGSGLNSVRTAAQNRALFPLTLLWLVAAVGSLHATAETARPYGLNSRPMAKPYLSMPYDANGEIPQRLSETGAFKSTADLMPTDSLVPYDINVSFWSDGAAKQRWISVPQEASSTGAKIQFAPTGEWRFPDGTVFVKHFEIATNDARPDLRRRLETRLIVCDTAGSVYGATYKWRPDNSDADLLFSNLTEQILVSTVTGVRTQNWYYPSRQDCRTCHTDLAGGVLGVKTRQLNRDYTYADGVVDNELRAWNHIGLFAPECDDSKLATYDKLTRADDRSHPIEARARSYLDANCAHCHRPGGTVAYFDARYDTPLNRQGLINGAVLIDEGLDRACVISSNDRWRSVALLRISSLEGLKMPPLAHEALDVEGITVLSNWIESLPGAPVVAPPIFSPRGGRYQTPTEVTLSHPDPTASIHYTLDGSPPAASDPIYERPIKVSEPVTLRARAYKPGSTKSIVVQETYVITN